MNPNGDEDGALLVGRLPKELWVVILFHVSQGRHEDQLWKLDLDDGLPDNWEQLASLSAPGPSQNLLPS